jgi:AcrR family transcriptional regulator
MKSQAANIRTPRERYRDELRRSILDAAREAFVEYGYEGVSMRQLAEQVGCTHGNLYVHFKDKEALFDCLVEESFEQFADGLRMVPEATRRCDPVKFLREAGAPYVNLASRTPAPANSPSSCAGPGKAGANLMSPTKNAHAGSALYRRKKFRRMDADLASHRVGGCPCITALLIIAPPSVGRSKS